MEDAAATNSLSCVSAAAMAAASRTPAATDDKEDRAAAATAADDEGLALPMCDRPLRSGGTPAPPRPLSGTPTAAAGDSSAAKA